MSFLRFPGVAGSYISTPDLNLLDADTAHVYQSIGQWATKDGTLISVVDEPSAFSGKAVQLTQSGASFNPAAWVGQYPNAFPVTVGQAYSWAADFKPVDTVADILINARWYEADGTIIGWSSPPTVSEVADEWVRTGHTFTAPTNAAWVAFVPAVIGSAANESHLVRNFAFREGTDSSFVPSMNIVGLSSVVVGPAEMQWSYTIGDEFQIGDGWAGDGISLVSRDGPGGPIVAEFQVPDIGIEEGAVPPGTQWQDTTGRTWTSSGSLEILDWLYGYPVEDLAAYLDAALPDGVQVYSHAADIGKLPAVVLVPGNPAIALTTMAGAEMTLAWGIEATLVVNRSQPLYGTRLLVDLWRQIATACIAYSETVQVLTLEEIGTVEWSGGEALAGTMPMILTQSEGT